MRGGCCRKPRLNAQLVAQQGAQQFAAPPKKDKNIFRRDRNSASTSSSPTNTMNSHKKERQVVSVAIVALLVVRNRSPQQVGLSQQKYFDSLLCWAYFDCCCASAPV